MSALLFQSSSAFAVSNERSDDAATGVAYCPCANMRLASGIAPVLRLRRAGWMVVREGRLTMLNPSALVATHNQFAAQPSAG